MRPCTTVLLVLLGIGVFLTGCGGSDPAPADNPPATDDNPPATGDTPDTTAAPPGEPDFTLTADAFYEEVIDNVTAAIAKFGGHVVEVTGEIAMFQRAPLDPNGRPSITVGEPAKPVICTTLDREPWLKCAPGQTIKIRGTVGANLFGAVSLNDCVFTVVSGDPATELTVEQLLAEITANEDEAEKKYDGKAVFLSGEFVSAKEGSITGEIVELKGDDKRPIVCETASGDSPWLEKLKPGDPVKFLGKMDVRNAGSLKLFKDEVKLQGAVLTHAPGLPK